MVDHTDHCKKSHGAIIIFTKDFGIDDATQKPTTDDVGPFIVVKNGTAVDRWELASDRWRWHCGTGKDEWIGPFNKIIDKAFPDYKKLLIPIVSGIFGDWNRTHIEGAKVVSVEYDGNNGDIRWSKV